MEYVAIAEKSCEDGCHHHSFSPVGWPNNVSQCGLTNDEQSWWNNAAEDDEQKALLSTRCYLPCHYFDYIGGSSTGA